MLKGVQECLCQCMTYYLCLLDCVTAGRFDISSHYQRQKGNRLQGAEALTHTINKTRCYYVFGVM